jgi:hypothetical protein
MQDGTLGTNPRQQRLSAWQVSRCWVIWILLVCDEFAEYSIQILWHKIVECFFIELIE